MPCRDRAEEQAVDSFSVAVNNAPLTADRCHEARATTMGCQSHHVLAGTAASGNARKNLMTVRARSRFFSIFSIFGVALNSIVLRPHGAKN
jgi:hypothetical protein